jgi:RNA polymerase sigma factor (sigma-70 family)
MDFFTFDDDYVRRLREGDPGTVKHYFEYFTPLLMATLRGRVSPNDVDDVVQDVHTRVLSNLKNGKPPEDGRKLGAYVYGICHNVRREYARRDRHTEQINGDFPSPDNEEQRQMERERKERVISALHRLARDHPSDAELLTDLFLHETDRDAVCRKLNVTRANLRVLLCRALKKFRHEYDHPDDS